MGRRSGRRALTAILLDTHAWAWSLLGSDRLSPAARGAILASGTVFVSPISFFEIARKVRLGKWREMAPFANQLSGVLKNQGGMVARLDPAICAAAGGMAWAHRDPFDRLLAATAIQCNLQLVSADSVFDGIVARIW